MKLILKEYLTSLKERKELDAILPDLLSEIGMTVFSKPGIGTRQQGVDVAAYGAIVPNVEKVYLFSIKSGDITRAVWDGDAHQSLRPSLNEILDAYIPNRIPNQYKDKPVVICICFGGDVQEQVRESFEGFKKANSSKGIEFEEWNGDMLAELILKSFLREDLMPKTFRSSFRKSLALLDEPAISFKHYSNLINSILNVKFKNNKERITKLRQLNICLWILFSWCRESNNLESAYLSAELTILRTWEICCAFFNKKDENAKSIQSIFQSIQLLHRQISNEYVKKIMPHGYKLHGISNAIKPLNDVDVNFKLFDLIGRIALNGIWSYWYFTISDEKSKLTYVEDIQIHSRLIKEIIINNPMLYYPYKDDHIIEISFVAWFLSLHEINHNDIHNWILDLLRGIKFNYEVNNKYPCILKDYYDLINHPVEKTLEYKKEVTSASVLYPTLALFAAVLGHEDNYSEIQKFKKSELEHSNFQLWYPDETTEKHFYKNDDLHGATFSNVPIEKSSKEFLTEVFDECEATVHFENLSAIKYGLFPLVLVGCRHYRIPMPIHFIKMLYIKKNLPIITK